MPTTIDPVAPVHTGIVSAPANAASTMQLANPRGNVLLRVANGSASSINVSMAAGATPLRPADGTYPAMTLAAEVIAVAAGAVKFIGPIPKAYNDVNSKVQFTFSATATVTVEGIQI